MSRPTLVRAPSALSAMTQLSPSVYLYQSFSTASFTHDIKCGNENVGVSEAETAGAPYTQPLQLGPISSSDTPRLIVLVTWMSAQPSHISKYIQGYQTLFPASSILLIRSSAPDFTYRSTRTQRYWITPAVSYILSACKNIKSDQAVILHVFSTGGSHQTSNLLRAYQDINSCPFPPHVTIFDSGPGRGRFKAAIRALSFALPKSQPLRFLLLLLSYLVISIYWLASVPTGIPDPIDRIRQALNDKQLLRSESSRCYVYSEADGIVNWRDVEDHAADAADKGFTVYSEKFDGTGHCAHVRVAEGTRYWAIVDRLWEARLK